MKILNNILSILFLAFGINISPQSMGWIEQQSGTNEYLNSCSFVDSYIGVAVGFNGVILRTTDGGSNWDDVANTSNQFLFDIQMVSYVIGWVVGENGIILKTSDSGINWTSQISNTQETLLSCSFVDENIGWIVGTNGIVLKTTNSGSNWNPVDVGINHDWSDVFFISKDTGWIVGGSNLLRTEDGGQSWSNINYVNRLNKIFLLDNNNAWSISEGVTFNTSILRTTDGGYSWETKLSSSSSGTAYRAIYFISEESGWTVGEEGLILMTRDAGETWDDQSVNISSTYLLDVEFVDSLLGWTVGQNGKIFKTTNGGVTFIEKDLNQVFDDYSLFQNYPNPFNPNTRISFSIPTINFVRLTIYNLNGELVETIMNEEKSAGTYSILWNSGEISSGLYFYKLEAGNFTETRKMIMLR